MDGTGMIALHGRLNGTLKYREENGGLELELGLRRKITGRLLLIAVSRDGSVRFSSMPDRRRGRIPASDICGAAVWDGDARLLCYGSLGGCSLAPRLGELRIMAASALKSAPPEAAEAPPEVSPATLDILAKAKELFAPLKAEKEKTPPAAQELADGEIYAVPNPFPKTYPNSCWHMRRGENAVYGIWPSPRGKLVITAVPGSRGRRPRGFDRFLIDVSGRGMWARERKA